jgi:hypothetical protein
MVKRREPKANVTPEPLAEQIEAFVAGADIAEMVNMNTEQGIAFSKTGQKTFRNLEKLEPEVAVSTREKVEKIKKGERDLYF